MLIVCFRTIINVGYLQVAQWVCLHSTVFLSWWPNITCTCQRNYVWRALTFNMRSFFREYPDFYHKLYVLLDRNVLHVKYRSRFFRLLDIFLSSTYVLGVLVLYHDGSANLQFADYFQPTWSLHLSSVLHDFLFPPHPQLPWLSYPSYTTWCVAIQHAWNLSTATRT